MSSGSSNNLPRFFHVIVHHLYRLSFMPFSVRPIPGENIKADAFTRDLRVGRQTEMTRRWPAVGSTI